MDEKCPAQKYAQDFKKAAFQAAALNQAAQKLWPERPVFNTQTFTALITDDGQLNCSGICEANEVPRFAAWAMVQYGL